MVVVFQEEVAIIVTLIAYANMPHVKMAGVRWEDVGSLVTFQLSIPTKGMQFVKQRAVEEECAFQVRPGNLAQLIQNAPILVTMHSFRGSAG